MKFNDFMKAIDAIVDTHLISKEEIISALTNATTSAFRKITGCPDAVVRLEINESSKNIDVFQLRNVVATEEEIIDDETEISVEALGNKYHVGDTYETPIQIEDFGRGFVHQFKQVLDQKIKEASKNAIYTQYIDSVDDLITGKIHTVEDKFTLIELDKTTAILPKSEQIPNERFKEGQPLRVIVKTVSKESKSAQVVVSRSSAMLVKRLFEEQVPEIFDGTVSIKCIAREAGERTKVGVYSKNVNVDPVATCIGPRGQRVSSVIEEITKNTSQTLHENIDIFEWDKNIITLIRNAMAPAEILGVYPKDNPEDGYVVVVDDDKLSVAIGKRGINVRLIVKLINKHIDIKTKGSLEAEGINWYDNYLIYQAKLESELRVKELEEEIKVEQPKVVEKTVEEVVEINKDNATEQEAKEIIKRKKAEKAETKASEYVSKFEKLADAKKQTEQVTSKKKKNKEDDSEEIERKKRLEELLSKQAEAKISYDDDEFDEFEKDGDEWDDDVDYDEYDEFYDDEN